MEDNKAFDGMVIDRNMLLSLRKSESKKALHSLKVMVSPLKKIYQEYRFFIVDYCIVTASLYKVDGNPLFSSTVPRSIVKYVESIINKWLPSPSVVIDCGLD